MTRHTIAAHVRGFRFALRADWADHACAVEIDASAAVDAPPGYEWQETGDVVGDWVADIAPLPLAVYFANANLPRPMSPTAVAVAVSALAGHVRAHFDDWEEFDDATARAIATATVYPEGVRA